MCNCIYFIILINLPFLQILNTAIYLFIFIIFCHLRIPMSYKTLGITLLFQFQKVHILFGITILISYYCHSHLIVNYKVRYPTSNAKKKKKRSIVCNICLLTSIKWIYKIYKILLGMLAIGKIYAIYTYKRMYKLYKIL
jgi:hypothetical protein